MTVKIGVKEIEGITLDMTVLGTGGRGGPHTDKLVARQAIEEFGPVELLPPDELGTDDSVIPTAQIDAPAVLVEKLPSGREAVASMERIERGLEKIANATIPIECDGINSTFPFAIATRHRLPVVDADGMGRAFPELQHETFNIYGVSGTPAAVSDEQGSTCLIKTEDNDQLEWLARDVTVRMGGVAYVSGCPMTGTQANETTIPGTISFAKSLGRTLRLAEDDAMSAIHEVTRESIYGEAWSSFEGKIMGVQRRTGRGFVSDHVDIDGLDGDEDSTMRIEFQSEDLGAAVGGNYVTTVPNLITVLSRRTGDPIPAKSLRYGARVRVLGIRTSEIMRVPAALDARGPASFGPDATYESSADHPWVSTSYA